MKRDLQGQNRVSPLVLVPPLLELTTCSMTEALALRMLQYTRQGEIAASQGTHRQHHLGKHLPKLLRLELIATTARSRILLP